MTSTVSIPLTELLLRPSTLRRFTKRGFESTDEIEESRANGGINLLASELDVSLQEAAGLIREVQGCLGSYQQQSRARSSGEGNSKTVGDGDGQEIIAIDVDDETLQQPPLSPTRDCDDGIVTAYELLRMNKGSSHDGKKQYHRRRHIVTFCRAIDDLIGGGIALGEVTEIAGMPGTGKTQLATQLSVLARLPQLYGGVEGRTLYVDSEGSFVAERAHSMAQALCQHVRGRAQYQQSKQKGNNALPEGFTTEGILDSIDVFRVHDEAALLATLYSLKQYIESTSDSTSTLPVKLIIIDSIAFHFRAVVPTDSSYYVQRTKTLTALAAYLGDLANQHNLAVVVINQMTTKIGRNNTGTSVVPALGESWAHATATRLLLSKDERFLTEHASSHNDDDETEYDANLRKRREVRTCSLIKSSHKPTGRASYRILEEGIRDVPGERERTRTSSSSSSSNHKRVRTS